MPALTLARSQSHCRAGPLLSAAVHINKFTHSHLNFHFFQTHGDFSTGTDPLSYGVGAASAEGYITRIPPGYAYILENTLDIFADATIDDQREDGSEWLAPWFLELAFQLNVPATPPTQQAPLRPASLFWLFPPCDSAYKTSSIDKYGNGFNTFNVQRVPSLVWWSGRMPASGMLLNHVPWLHTHRARFSGVLVLAASLAELNFSCRSFGVTNVSAEHSRAADLSAIRRRLLASGRVVCQDDQAVPDFVDVKPSAHLGIAGGMYERQGRLRCEPWAFRSGDRYSVFGFFRPRWHSDIRHMGMHLAAFLHVDLGNPNASFDATLVGETFNPCTVADEPPEGTVPWDPWDRRAVAQATSKAPSLSYSNSLDRLIELLPTSYSTNALWNHTFEERATLGLGG